MEYFLWPFCVLLLPVPFLVRVFLSGPRETLLAESDALRVPFFNRVQAWGVSVSRTARPVRNYFLILAWICFVVALMRPFKYDTAVFIPQEARNIMLAIDASGSMRDGALNQAGYPVSRMVLVKNVVADFIKNRPGDRIGLIVFGTNAYTLAPLSLDKNTLSILFQDVEAGIAGEQTSVGDALALGVKNMAKIPEGEKVLILLSDGVSNSDSIPIPQALKLAQKHGVKIYTIGLGYDYDEAVLKQVADKTGGKYFNALSGQDLTAVYRQIDALEKTKLDEKPLRPQQELFYLPLSLMMLFWGLAVVKRGQK